MITRPSHGLTVAPIKIDPEICRFEFSHHSGVGATAGFLLSFTQPFGVIKLLGREGASNFFKVFKSHWVPVGVYSRPYSPKTASLLVFGGHTNFW